MGRRVRHRNGIVGTVIDYHAMHVLVRPDGGGAAFWSPIASVTVLV